MRIGFDSDGVLDNFGEGVRQTLEVRGLGHLWKSGPTKKPFWNFFEDWGWDYPQFKELVDWGVDNGYIFTGHWREGAIEAVQKVKSLGHEVIIITDRAFGSNPFNSQKNTMQAFKKAGIEYDELYFSADKCCVPLDMMVEDKLENYDKLVANGVTTFLINRPWNEQEDDRVRIDCVMDYANIVEAVTLSDKLFQS